MVLRVFVADKHFCGVRFVDSDTKSELGVVMFNLVDGVFSVMTWPKDVNILWKISQLFYLLSMARRITKDSVL